SEWLPNGCGYGYRPSVVSPARGRGDHSVAPDRSSVEQAVHDRIAQVAHSGVHSGTSIVLEGPPGIGKTHLAREVLASLADGPATILTLEGERGRRLQPFAG